MTVDLKNLAALADACIHCGLCLPACPTYAELGTEPDSPRGRIYLMRALIEGRIEPDPDVVVHLDRCLGCRACETACPSKVHYGQLLEGVRATIAEPSRRMGVRRLLWRPIIRHVLPFRERLRLMLLPLRLLARADRRMLPPVVRRSVDSLPAQIDRDPLPPLTGSKKTPARARAGYLAGCAMPVLFAHVNSATVRLLAAAGYDVVVPARSGCCGALSAHDGDAATAAVACTRTMAAFADCDIVVTDVAGCGAALKEYPDATFRAKIRDLSEALLEADWKPERPLQPARVVYHDPCHLRHGQGITAQPRELLQRAGLTLVEAAEGNFCCGGAGSYTLLQPALSTALMERKVKHLLAVEPTCIVTANPSCLMQIQAGLRAGNNPLPIRHLAEVLADTLA